MTVTKTMLSGTTYKCIQQRQSSGAGVASATVGAAAMRGIAAEGNCLSQQRVAPNKAVKKPVVTVYYHYVGKSSATQTPCSTPAQGDPKASIFNAALTQKLAAALLPKQNQAVSVDVVIDFTKSLKGNS